MRDLRSCIFVFAALVAVVPLYAQTTPLPPGTTSPDADSAQSPQNASARAAALLSSSEDDIVHGEYQKALLLLSHAIAKEPADSPEMARALYDRGYAEQEQHDLTAAEADFRKASATDPKQFESHAALGRLLLQQSQWQEARHELELAAALTPASGNPQQAIASVERALAQVDAQLQDPAGASDALMAALKLTPEQLDDTLLAAQLAADEGNQAGAESEFRKALTANPKSISAAEGLARALNHEGKFANAETALQQPLQQEPNDPTLLAESATALAGQGKTETAIAQLEALHRQDPDQPAVTRMLADLYSGAGEAAKAGPLYQQLLTSEPQNPDLLTAAGENLILQQQWGDAVRTLQNSLRLEPAQGEAWSGLAFAALQDGDYPLVLTALDQRAQYLTDTPATIFLRASALDHLHHTRQAVPYYQQFLREAQGKFPDEEAQTRQRLAALGKSH